MSSPSSMEERTDAANMEVAKGGLKRRASPEQTFVLVTDDEVEEKGKIELPLEDDGSLRLSTLSHAFAGAYGLKYKNPDTGAYRGLKVDEQERIHPPPEGWGNTVYIIIFQKTENTKRKMDDQDSSGVIKQKRLDQKKCSDLVALGIPYKTTEEELREYFEQFGEVVVSQVKRDHKTQKSKGFGFVRFADYESQLKALAAGHSIDGRSVEVKIPNSKEQGAAPQSKKIFVGRLPESLTTEELKTYFEVRGEVTDVYIPRPFRAFAFVTFSDPEVAQSLCGEDHVINGNSVHVSQAVPKQDNEQSPQQHRGGGYGGAYGGGYGDEFGYSRSKGGGKASRQGRISPPWHKEVSPQYGHKGMISSRYSGPEVWSQSHYSRYSDHHLVPVSPNHYSSSQAAPWSLNPAQQPNMRGAVSQGDRNTPLGYGSAHPHPQAMYADAGAGMPQVAIPPNAVSASTNQATVGLGNLNLNQLITPDAIQAALTSALAGLLPQGNRGQPGVAPGAGQPGSGIDLTALLSSLQATGGMPQFGGVAVTTSNTIPWPNAAAVSSQMAKHQGQPDMVVTSAGNRHDRSWQDEEVNGERSWRHDM